MIIDKYLGQRNIALSCICVFLMFKIMSVLPLCNDSNMIQYSIVHVLKYKIQSLTV
jgi:hypothetical protein